MSNMIYALVGPHAAGKATLASQLISMGIHFIPTYTTYQFPSRGRGQQKSKSAALYHTVSREEFNHLDLVVQFTHKGDFYGIRKKDILDAIEEHQMSVMILENTGIKQLSKLIKNKLCTIYLMVDYVTLIDRMLHQGYTNDEIKYHLQYAENNKEFDSWKVATQVIKNTTTLPIAMSQLLAIMGLSTIISQEQLNQLIK